MQNMNIAQYLILDAGFATSLRELQSRFGSSDYQYTETGMIILPIGTSIPLIIQGRECIGLAIVKSINITQTKTTIKFTAQDTDPTVKKVLYDMYRNQLGKSSTSSVSENVVPAMNFTNVVNKVSELERKKKDKKRRNDIYPDESLSSVFDRLGIIARTGDDDDDDDYDSYYGDDDDD